ncbi:phospholipid carrier-dependent glycosyltransferase [Nocardioides guangzhouensis]|uniref:Phospholipid carrier-dependent glycosyltransferase n=1 Tax=Nocardioides guangzhouensis TaxID=2497878 RepID=A0A4V1XYG1_9ACTN|nr:glycosyltransferase family 39 protein [Nocardioides guangzhouensis]RYP83129.1 phospholipid carrier-dependent glycosyltransferase [Nocardioides guangzhouensis]
MTSGHGSAARWLRSPALPWAVGAFLVLLASAGSYGYHRDELYFLAIGAHPHLGAPDQPAPVPLLAHAISWSTGESLVALRVLPALAMAAVVILTGVLARELGADRRAQGLAAALVAVGSLTFATGHLFSTTTFDVLAWTVITLLVLRHLRDPSPRSWVVLGVTAGVALEIKVLVVFLLVGLLVGVLLTARDVLATWWALLSAAISLALAAPFLGWQAAHGWPQLDLARAIAEGGSGTSTERAAFWPTQLGIMGPAGAAAWIPGLVRLFRDPAVRRFRAFAVAYVVLGFWFTVTGAKAYYLAGLYPVLVAAGSVPLLAWLRRAAWRRVVGGIVFVATAAVSVLLFVPWHPDPPPAFVVDVNYDMGEQVGWPMYVAQVRAVAEAAGTDSVVTSNYGEAGALVRYAPSLDVSSGHNGFWYLGGPDRRDVLVLVGVDPATAGRWCDEATLARRLENVEDVDNDEQGAPVWVCRGFRPDWTDVQVLG